jgi:arylsulfatase A-like enzyme
VMDKPNVLLLAVDSLRADAIFTERVPTPNIDAYATAGAAFRQCVATATITTPSFSSILTGCYPPRHGLRSLKGYRLSPSVTTMAESFSAAGFETHAEVTGPLLPETGVLRGFGDIHHRPGYNVPFFEWRERVVESMEGYSAPWFLLLHTFEVHRPFRPPPSPKARWDRSAYEAVVAATDEWLRPVFDAAGPNTIVVLTGDHGENYPETTWNTRLNRAAGWLRRNLHTARWARRLDERLAAVAVGHGYGVDETLLRVPLIISGPGVPPSTIEQQMSHVDLFPTLADLCELAPPTPSDGRSLVGMLHGESLPDLPAYSEAGMKVERRRVSAARTSRYKLVRKGVEPPVLYELNGQYRWDGRSVPDEPHNVYHREPETARELEAWMDRICNDPHAEGSGMNPAEEAVVEQHLRDLGYL